MKLQDTLELHVKAAVKELFQADLESVEFQVTRKEFAGDITVVVFPMLRVVKGNPVAIGEQIGQYLKDNVALVKGFNVVKGFLNIEIDDSYYIDFFNSIKDQHNYGFASLKDDKAVMVEYSSPNTNKPLHLGHVRNVLLGYSVSEILKASGKKVYKTQIINDRGIHICKSMLAWQRFGNGETPESTGLKGDKLVGNYYVKFDEKFRDEVRGKLDNASSLLNEFLRESFKKGELNMPKVMKEVDQEHNGVFMKLANIKMDWLEKKSESIKFNDYSRSSYDILYSSVFEHLLENEESALLIDDLIKIFDQDLIKYFDKERVKLLEDLSKTYFSEDSKLQNQAQEMLRQWEAGDKEVVALWEKMNGWVYEGFEATYKAIGVDFDEYYYESQTYLLENGLEVARVMIQAGIQAAAAIVQETDESHSDTSTIQTVH